ncbi:MAG: hypothetical protein ABIZ34_03370 [Candidatus Limnocylindrales bacterium]
MYIRDRVACLASFAGAGALWYLAWTYFNTRSPVDDTGVQATGSLLLGSAVGLTLLPLFWLAGFARRRIAYRGDWWRALRRALLTAAVIALLVLLKVLGGFSVPIAAFVVVMAVVLEIILTSRQ